MSRIFVNQTKLIFNIDTEHDLTGVIETKIKYLKPSKEQGEFNAYVSGTSLLYNFEDGDLDGRLKGKG